MPSSVTPLVSWFDRFATAVSRFVSKAWFFTACVLLIVLWAPSFFLVGNLDTWQLIINTITTIVTFLLVALLQNSQTRADAAVRRNSTPSPKPSRNSWPSTTHSDAITELRDAVGLEHKESS